MSASHSLVRNNPYLPFQCSIPGRDFYYFKYPHTLRAAKLFLRTLPPTHLATAEMHQCSKCHRYVTGAPSPGLDHQGGVQGPLCALPHHPPICTWTDTRGNPCSFHFSSDPSDKSPTETPTQELERLRREKDEASKRADLLQVANTNLRESQVQRIFFFEMVLLLRLLHL